MIRSYALENGKCRIGESTVADAEFPANACWVDLISPTLEEEKYVEAELRIDIPTRDELKEIEVSSRLYQDGDAMFMTATLITNADAEHPESTIVTFVLTPRALVTVRYGDPVPFRAFSAQTQRFADTCSRPEVAFAGLLDAIIDRVADILEATSVDLDRLSHDVFEPRIPGKVKDFQHHLHRLGRSGDIVSKVRESLMTLSRLIAFARQRDRLREDKETSATLKTVDQDIESLSDNVTFLSNKITFLLNATLGMINIEQNAIIKIFSVVAVMFLPPTLVASVYGMNFRFMPELHWMMGYPLALAIMVASMLVPFWFFKRKGWL